MADCAALFGLEDEGIVDVIRFAMSVICMKDGKGALEDDFDREG